MAGGPLPEPQPRTPAPTPVPVPGPLPATPEAVIRNTGVGAELEVARDLQRLGWELRYTGNFKSFGYDLHATQHGDVLRVEVKSSVGLCTPELREEEWAAAQRYGNQYVLAVVDFFGSQGQRLGYLRNPAANVVPIERTVIVFRVTRQDIVGLMVDGEFL